jgi:hypothetical protein
LFTTVNFLLSALVLNPRLVPIPSCNSTSPLCDVMGDVEFCKFYNPIKGLTNK